jgi:hypothetical protein
LVHFLVDKVNLQRLRQINTLPIFSSEKEMNVTMHTSNQTAAQMAENIMDVCLKFQSDLVNRFISLVRCNTSVPVSLKKKDKSLLR